MDEIRARELASQYYDSHPELHIYDINLDMEYSESDEAWGADLIIGSEDDPDIAGFILVRDDGTVCTYGLDTPDSGGDDEQKEDMEETFFALETEDDSLFSVWTARRITDEERDQYKDSLSDPTFIRMGGFVFLDHLRPDDLCISSILSCPPDGGFPGGYVNKVHIISEEERDGLVALNDAREDAEAKTKDEGVPK